METFKEILMKEIKPKISQKIELVIAKDLMDVQVLAI